MPNFVYDNTSLNGAKVNRGPLPGGEDPNKWIQANEDWNPTIAALYDLRGALLDNLFLGLDRQGSAPIIPTGGADDFLWADASGNLYWHKDGTGDQQLNTGPGADTLQTAYDNGRTIVLTNTTSPVDLSVGDSGQFIVFKDDLGAPLAYAKNWTGGNFGILDDTDTSGWIVEASALSMYGPNGAGEFGSAGFTIGAYAGGGNTNRLTVNYAGSNTIRSGMADGAAAVSLIVDTHSTWANATAKLLSVRNNTAERIYVEADGDLGWAGNAIIRAAGNASYAYLDGTQFIAAPANLTRLTITSASSNTITSGVANGAGAVGLIIDSTNALSNATAKVLSIRSGGTEIASFSSAAAGYSKWQNTDGNGTSIQLTGSTSIYFTIGTNPRFFFADSELTPQNANYSSLGRSSLQWVNVYAKNHISDLAMTFTTTVASGSSRTGFTFNDTNLAATTDRLVDFQRGGNSAFQVGYGTMLASMPWFGFSSTVGFSLQAGSQIQFFGTTLYPQSNGQLGAFNAGWFRTYCYSNYSFAKTATYAATMAFDSLSGGQGEIQTVTLTGNITSWSITRNANNNPGQRMSITFVQDGTGGHTLSGHASNIKLRGALTLSTAPAARDTLIFMDNGTEWVEIGRYLEASSGGETLAATYAAGVSTSDSKMTVDSTRGPVFIRDNATPVVGNLFVIKNNAEDTTYFAAGADYTSLAAGMALFDLSSTTATIGGHIRTNVANTYDIGSVTHDFAKIWVRAVDPDGSNLLLGTSPSHNVLNAVAFYPNTDGAKTLGIQTTNRYLAIYTYKGEVDRPSMGTTAPQNDGLVFKSSNSSGVNPYVYSSLAEWRSSSGDPTDPESGGQVISRWAFQARNDTISVGSPRVTDRLQLLYDEGTGTYVQWAYFGITEFAPSSDLDLGLGTYTKRWTTIHQGNDSVDDDQIVGIHLSNKTGAGAGDQEYSPMLALEGQGWKTNATAGSQQTIWALQTRPVEGAANPTAELVFWESINGGAYGEKFCFAHDGIPRWSNASNVQTTVGAAGGASALPASPTKYLKVQGDDGTTYVIPAFAAS